MSRQQKDPLRNLTAAERTWLKRVSRAQRAPAAPVVRATLLLAVAAGQGYPDAARRAGRRSTDAVSPLVSRFNKEGLAAVEPRHGAAPRVTDGASEGERMLAAGRRTPDRATDGSATWSLSLLQGALREAADGLPSVSRDTMWRI